MNDIRNWLARQLLQAANRIATAHTMCSTKQEWQFRREWRAEPYSAVPQSKFCRPNSQ